MQRLFPIQAGVIKKEDGTMQNVVARLVTDEVFESAVNTVLDEARREFPFFPKDKLEGITMDDIRSLNTTRKEWFLKQFGTKSS